MLVFIGCSTSEDTESTPESVADTGILADFVTNQDVRIDNVIACASGSQNPNEIVAYVYPRPGATDIRFYETESAEDDKDDYTKYTRIPVPEEDFFNGFLKSFTRQTEVEKWVIISFRESGQIHLSNPIRLKHLTQNTDFTATVTINQEITQMPTFSWANIEVPQDAIYFQVVSDTENELLSGTYTFETQFQYYNLENVVLNITEETPPDLIVGDSYGFTVMGVSEDNWVNTLLQSSFTAE